MSGRNTAIALHVKRETQLSLTNRRDAFMSLKVTTKHSTISYVRHSFLLCNRNFVFKTRRFYDIRLQKCRDLETRVRDHLRSLKVVPIYRFGVVSY